jgi:Xaa-Pro aminopeptidase
MNDTFARRRARVLEQLTEHDILIIAAAPEVLIGRDTHLRYVVDAELYYLTGYTEPDAVLVLAPGSDHPFTMFVRDRDPERELWNGRRGGVAAATEMFGADLAYPTTEFASRLPKLLAAADTLFVRESGRPQLDGVIQQAIVNGRNTRARTGHGPHVRRDPGDILDEMRLIKDTSEIALLREACRITAEAFLEAIPRIKPGMNEWEVEAMIEYGFRSRGASGPSFTTIAAAAGNATVLHYVENNARLEHGSLLLLDAGARYQMYCGDITRTVPVGGRFGTEQRALYEIVYAAQQAAIAQVQPGKPVDDVHSAARTVLMNGLIERGMLRADERDDENALRRFYPHRTSHWLGLEVHDVGPYVRADGPVLLEPGMVLTIEPGVYAPDLQIGIRIEDDVLVTSEGHDVLTGTLPGAPDDVEALLR